MPACCLPPTCGVGWAPSACCGERTRGAGRRVMGTTRAYACTTPAGLTRLGSPVRRTSRGGLRVRTRRATLASVLPWRGACTRRYSLEWSPQKPSTIPGAPLGAWHARRKLYQHGGNLVGSVRCHFRGTHGGSASRSVGTWRTSDGWLPAPALDSAGSGPPWCAVPAGADGAIASIATHPSRLWYTPSCPLESLLVALFLGREKPLYQRLSTVSLHPAHGIFHCGS
jgi:hypothetical protein